MKNGSSGICSYHESHGEEGMVPCRVCVTAELLAVPFHLPSSPWKNEKSDQEEKDQTVQDALFPCECTAVEDCPFPELAPGLPTSWLEVQADLTVNGGTHGLLYEVSQALVLSTSGSVIREWGKAPRGQVLFLGPWAVQSWLMKFLRAKGFCYLSSQKKKRGKKAAVQSLSLHRPLAPSSVFISETQAQMSFVFCLLPSSLPPTDCFLNKTRHRDTVQVQQTFPLWSCYLLWDPVILTSLGGNRDLWSNRKLFISLKLLSPITLKSVDLTQLLSVLSCVLILYFMVKERFLVLVWITSMGNGGNAAHCLSVKLWTIPFPFPNPIPSSQSMDY